MPNWCYTTIIIDGPEKEIEFLYNKITSWSNMPDGNDLRNFLRYACVDFTNYDCRGTIDKIRLSTAENNDKHIVVSTGTAWTPKIQMWRAIVNSYSKNCRVFFYAEECGTDIYMTNDVDYKYFPEDYSISINIVNPKYQFARNHTLKELNDYGDCRFNTKDFLEAFREELGNRNADEQWIINRLEELNEMLIEDDIEDQYVNVREIERDAFLDTD